MRNLLAKQDPILKKKRKRKIYERERIKDALRTYGLGSEKRGRPFPSVSLLESIDQSFAKLKKKYFKAKEAGLKISFVDFLQNKEIEGTKASEVYSTLIKGKGIFKYGMNLPFTSNYKFEWGLKVNSLSNVFGDTFFYTNDYMGVLGYVIVCQLLRQGEFKFVSIRPLIDSKGQKLTDIEYDKVMNGNTVYRRVVDSVNAFSAEDKYRYAYYDASALNFDYADATIESYLYSAAILPNRDELYFPRITCVDGNESLFIQPWCMTDSIPKNDAVINVQNGLKNFSVSGIIDFKYRNEPMTCILAKKRYTFPNGEKKNANFVFVMKTKEISSSDEGNLQFNASLFQKFYFPLTKEEYKNSTDKFTRIIVNDRPVARGVYKDEEEMGRLNAVSKIFYMGGKPDKAISQNVFVPPGTTDTMNVNLKISVPAAFFVNNADKKEAFFKAFDLKGESGWNVLNIKKYIHFYLCSVDSLRNISLDTKLFLNALWEYKVYVAVLAKAYKKTLSTLKKILKIQANITLDDIYSLSKEISDLSAFCQLIYDGVIGDAPMLFLKEIFTKEEFKSEKSTNFLNLNFLQLRNSLRGFISYLTDIREADRIKHLRNLTGYFMNIYSSICLTNDYVSFNIAYNQAALDETYKLIGSYLEDFDKSKKEIEVKEEVDNLENILEGINTALEAMEEKNVKYGDKIKNLEKDIVGETSLDRRSQIKNEISFYRELLRLRDPERWQLFKDKNIIQNQINAFKDSGKTGEMKLDLKDIGPETMKIIKYAQKYNFAKLPKDTIDRIVE